MAVLPGTVSARVYVPLPVIEDVTSTVVHVPLLKPPEVSRILPTAGALLYVIVDSPQVLLLTLRIS